METREEIVAELEKNKEGMRRYGITRYRLFGSFARNEQRKDSDVDLIADVKEENVLEAEAYLTELLGRPVQVLPEEIITAGRLKNNETFLHNLMENKPVSIVDFLKELNRHVAYIQRKILTMSIERIFTDDEQDEDALDYRKSIERTIEQMGDVCLHLKKKFPDFVTAHPELKIELIYQQRNRIAHEYWNTDAKILKENILQEITTLKIQLEKLIHEHE